MICYKYLVKERICLTKSGTYIDYKINIKPHENLRTKNCILSIIICQIKEYGDKELEEKLEIEKTEQLLESPELVDIEWREVSPLILKTFTDFIDGFTQIYTDALTYLNEKEKLLSQQNKKDLK